MTQLTNDLYYQLSQPPFPHSDYALVTTEPNWVRYDLQTGLCLDSNYAGQVYTVASGPNAQCLSEIRSGCFDSVATGPHSGFRLLGSPPRLLCSVSRQQTGSTCGNV